MTALPEHLRAATADRTQQATSKARKAINQLNATNQPISFAAVARAASVSTDFLYRHDELRRQIERHRDKSGHRRTPPATVELSTSDSATSAAVRALARKLQDERRTHRATMAELRKALEVTHGENLQLRRRLATYEPN